MDKPDWNDAPEWAMWLAQDETGTYMDHYWVWFEEEPHKMSNGWISDSGTWRQTGNVATLEDWRKTLEPRP